MKVLLIDPPFKRFTGYVNYYFPLGLAYLASIGRNFGFDVKIYEADAVAKGSDINFSDEYKRLELYVQGLNDKEHSVWKDITKTLEKCKPDVIGISAMTFKLGSVIKTAEICKDWNSECKIIVGGAHPTINPAQMLTSSHIDIVVRGEGETVFPKVLTAIESGSNLSGIRGISFKENGNMVHNEDAEFIKDLDEVPLPARGLLMNKKNYTSEDMGMMLTSRGCPFNCAYCFHMWSRKTRFRSAENIVEEIMHVMDTYGTRQFTFKDDSFTAHRKRVIELCDKIIQEKLDINWDCTTRVDILDEELLKKMIKAGCNVIKVGVETGSEKILRDIKKGITFDKVRATAKLLNKHGVFWSAYFMMGLPTETEEDIMATYKFMKEINPYYAALGVYSAFPGTELFDVGIDMGLLDPDVDIEHFLTTNPKDYFFKNPSKRMAYITTERFDELTNFMMDAFHKHNTQPRNLIRRGWARRKVYMNDQKLLISDCKKALNWVVH